MTMFTEYNKVRQRILDFIVELVIRKQLWKVTIMTKKNKLVYIYELTPGMILSKDIRANGKVLIAKGVTITEYAINKLRQQYIPNKIEIYYEDNNEKHKNNNEGERVRNVEEIEESLCELTFDVKKIYEDMNSLKMSDIKEIRKFAAKIQAELKFVNSVIKNIVLYGSGSDTIYRHGVNVAALSTILGKWIGLSDSDLNLLTYSAIFHDFGKVKIDQQIIDKPGHLTPNELKEIKFHPALGYKYIKQIPFLDKSVSYGVLMHHERMDGSGYPLGLKENNIHKFGRIIAIADVFDAVNSDRVYKKSRRPFEALEIIKEESLGKLDYEYCNIFLNHIVNYYIGENAELNTKKVCKIIQIDVNNLAEPLLLDDTGFVDLKQHKELYIEKLAL
jgi:HD-GYP domain-containing protein (c-di-GMP phosphodiesterase class II)